MTTQQTSLALLVTFLACSAYAKIIADEGGPPMVWMGPPPHKLYNAGQVDPIRLPCQASGHPEPRIEWFYNGERLDHLTVPPGHVDKDGTTLLVEGRRVEGVYQCKAFNQFGVGLSNTSFLEEAYTIYKPRSFTKVVIKKEVTEGHDVTISCDHIIDSRPKAVIKWHRVTDYDDRGYLVRETDIISQDEEGNLIISRVDRSLNDAMFKCYAANPVKLGSRGGQKTRIIVLTDQYHFNKTRVPNYIYSTQSPHVVLEGQKNVQLKCVFGGWPAPRVQWSRNNGEPLPVHARVGEYSHLLTFDQVTREDDGNYDCWADNGAKSSVYQIYLKVEARPVITTPLQGRSVPAGSDVIFTCLADGIPIPQIQWFIDDKTISESNKKFKWDVSEDGADLSLYGITMNDTSSIHCNASNKHGYVLASTALRVYPGPSTTPTSTVHPTTEQPINIQQTDHMTTLATDNSLYSTVADHFDAEPLEFAVNATFESVLSNTSAFSGLESIDDVTDDVTMDDSIATTTTKMAAINGTNLAWTGDDFESEIAYDNPSVSEGAQNNLTAQNLHFNSSAITEPSESFNSVTVSELSEFKNSTPTDDFLLTTSSDNSTSRLLLFNVLPTPRSGASNATFHLTSVANNNFTFSNTTAETRTLAPQPTPTSTLADIPNAVVVEDSVAPSTKKPPTPRAKEPSSTEMANFLPEFPEVKTYKPGDPADIGNAIGQMEKEHGPVDGSEDTSPDQMIILAAVVSIAVVILFGLLIFLILLFRRRRRNYNVTDREYELGYVPGSPEAKPIYSVPEAQPVTPQTEASEDQNFIIESTNV